MDSFYTYCNPNFATDFVDLGTGEIFLFGGKKYTREPKKEVSKSSTTPSTPLNESDKESSSLMMGTQSGPFEDFLQDFRSLYWFTYRKDMPPISPSNYTTDMGWGCMLRSGQMILAEALNMHLLGKKPSDNKIADVHSKILRMFEDDPNSHYSIHKIAQLGTKYGKKIGEWFGPSTICQVLGALLSYYSPENLATYVSNDSVLYLDEIRDVCQHGTNWKSVFIVVPLRLGLDSINEIYIPSIKKVFHIPQSLGIIGGKPRSAMYFVGYQDYSLFYLDPHTVQPTVSVKEDQFAAESFHCTVPQKMLLSSIDPSMALGFYCRDKADFDDFWQSAFQLSQNETPLFSLANEAPDYRSQTKKPSLSLEQFEDDIVIL